MSALTGPGAVRLTPDTTENSKTLQSNEYGGIASLRDRQRVTSGVFANLIAQELVHRLPCFCVSRADLNDAAARQILVPERQGILACLHRCHPGRRLAM